eukprot:g1931.t1
MSAFMHSPDPYGDDDDSRWAGRRARAGSGETLSPGARSPSRKSTLPASVFNLVATIIGGGVLSLPFAFAKAGLVLGIGSIVLSAAMSDFSVYILVAAARRSGTASFEELAQKAFGTASKVITVTLVFLLTYCCCVAYIVLIGDLATPVAELAVHPAGGEGGADAGAHSLRTAVMAIAISCVLPLCFMKTLHALRFTSFLCIGSVTMLMITVAYRTLSCRAEHGSAPGPPFPTPAAGGNGTNGTNGTGGGGGSGGNGTAPALSPYCLDLSQPGAQAVQLWPDSLWDALYVFPITSVAYLCHFNVLPVHSELHRPTRTRMSRIIFLTMLTCSVLYVATGLFGYFYAFGDTCGNILKNFSSRDPVISTGRVALSLTLLLSFPLLVLPCRDSLTRLLGMAAGAMGLQRQGGAAAGLDDSFDLDDAAAAATAAAGAPPGGGDAELAVGSGDRSFLQSPLISNERRGIKGGQGGSGLGASCTKERLMPLLWRALLTLGLVGTSLVIALEVESVVDVWSVMGATVSFMIAFVLPCVLYLKVRWHKKMSCRRATVWTLLGSAIILSGFCTYTAAINFGQQPACVNPDSRGL